MKKYLLTILIALLLFLQPVFAQANSNFWSGIYSVVFIIVFILILLAVGGVLHFPSMGTSGHWLSVIIFFIIVFILPYVFTTYLSDYFPSYYTVPDNFKIYPLPSYASQALEAIGLPSDWMYVPAIIYLFILPFAGIYVLVWAFLIELKIFSNKNVNRLLALIITFMTIPIGWFTKVVILMFAGIGIWSLVIFVAAFVLGILFRGASVARKEYATYTTYATYQKQANDFKKYTDKVLTDLKNRGVPAEKISGLEAAAKQLLADVSQGNLTFKGAKTQFDKLTKS